MKSFEVYKAYQVAVHGDALEDLQLPSYLRFLVHSPLVVSRFLLTLYTALGAVVSLLSLDLAFMSVTSVYLFPQVPSGYCIC